MKTRTEWTVGMNLLISILLLSACGDSKSNKKTDESPGPSGPPMLALGAPMSGTVAYGTSNTFTVATTPGTAYSVTLTGMGAGQDADLSVSHDNIGPASCTVDHTQLIASFPEDCTVTAAGNALFVKVIGYSTADYLVYGTPAPVGGGVNEGTVPSPLPFGTGFARVSRVGAFGDSFYSVSVNGTVTLTLSAISNPAADVDLNVYTDSSFTVPAPCNPNDTVLGTGQPESCKVTWSGPLYVWTPEYNTQATAFLLLVK